MATVKYKYNGMTRASILVKVGDTQVKVDFDGGGFVGSEDQNPILRPAETRVVDPEVQKAIESNPRFKNGTIEKVNPVKKEELKKEQVVEEVGVKSIQEAVNYLKQGEYNLKGFNLNDPKSVVKAAEKNGVTFVGIEF